MTAAACSAGVGFPAVFPEERGLRLRVFPQRFAVCRLPKGAGADAVAAVAGEFVAVVRTADEVSVVCEEDQAPPGSRVEGGWRLLRVAGTLDFTQVGSRG